MNINRRLYFNRFARMLGVSVVGASAVFQKVFADDSETIAQPEETGPSDMMRRAFDMRQLAVESGDQAYGGVIVKANKIIGQAPSRVIVNNDPTAHAEVEAIRDATRRLQSRDLSGCTMYSSTRPCPMCEAAAYWAGIERLVYSEDIIDGGHPRLSRC
ncbi:MAG: nucleoside deaminase [Gammaproteobacteria bacterium]|nr:nucleoside deaminase [Gammaproteobacteria bacterium]